MILAGSDYRFKGLRQFVKGTPTLSFNGQKQFRGILSTSFNLALNFSGFLLKTDG